MDAGQPHIEVLRQPNEAFGIGGNGLDDGLVKPNPDWELYEHGAQAAERINTMLAIEPHRLL